MLKRLTLTLTVSLIIAPVAIAQGTGTSSNTTYSAPETNTPSSAKPGSPGQPDASVTDQEACKTLPSTGAQPPKTPGSQAEPQPQARCQAK